MSNPSEDALVAAGITETQHDLSAESISKTVRLEKSGGHLPIEHTVKQIPGTLAKETTLVVPSSSERQID